MSCLTSPIDALLSALDFAGSQQALAKICGVSQTAVWKWLQSGKPVPAEFVLRVEAATGVPRHHLRPDIYPADLGPSPRWHGVDLGAMHVSLQNSPVLQPNGSDCGAIA